MYGCPEMALSNQIPTFRLSRPSLRIGISLVPKLRLGTARLEAPLPLTETPTDA